MSLVKLSLAEKPVKIQEGSGPVGAWGSCPKFACGRGRGDVPTAPLLGRNLLYFPFTQPFSETQGAGALSPIEPARPPKAVHGRPAGRRGVVYHNRHHGLLFGAARAVWAVCNRTWSSLISRRRASSSSAWVLTWDSRTSSRCSSALSWPFVSWSSLVGISTCHRNPWAVGSWWAVRVPLPMRRLIVSADTRRRVAASPMDTVSTSFPLVKVGTSIGVRLGGCVGVAHAGLGRFGVLGVGQW